MWHNVAQRGGRVLGPSPRIQGRSVELGAGLRVEGRLEPVEWPLDDRSFDQGSAWAFTTTFGLLDIHLRPDGTGGFPDLRRDAAEPLNETLTVVVASLADVIRSEEAAGRDKDLRVLPALRLVQERAG